jgi:hypothetical protein
MKDYLTIGIVWSGLCEIWDNLLGGSPWFGPVPLLVSFVVRALAWPISFILRLHAIKANFIRK